jgi:hypothetical protein
MWNVLSAYTKMTKQEARLLSYNFVQDFRKLLVVSKSLFGLMNCWAKSIPGESSVACVAATGRGFVSWSNPIRCLKDVGKQGKSLLNP